MFNIVDLKSVCDIQSGGTPSRNENSFYNGNVKWAKISDLEKAGDGFIYDTEEYISESGLKDIRNRIFEVDTLFFAMYGSVGKTAITKDKMSCNQAILGITVNNTNLIDLKYLKYYFELTKEKLINSARGVALKNLSAGLIKELKIPLPPLETQKHIAQILDDAAALRDKTRQLIKEYDALAQSIFFDMFGDPVKNDKGWEKVSLINLCKKIQIGPFGSQLHQADYKDCGIPLINPTNIKNGKVDYSKIAFISEKKYMSLPNYHLQVGDVLMARRGDLSKIGLVIDEKCFCGTGSLFLRPNQKLHPIYAISVLAHKSTIDKLYEKAQGITMANLNKSIVSSLEVTVPPITLQNQFAEKITLIEQQKELAKQELKESEDLFNCLLQKAFKGELN